MPTIAGSEESGTYAEDDTYRDEDDLESLQAEGSVTASDSVLLCEMGIVDTETHSGTM